jgi:hypothetical protein
LNQSSYWEGTGSVVDKIIRNVVGTANQKARQGNERVLGPKASKATSLCPN